MKLLALTFVIIRIRAIDPCIHSYPDYTIDHITDNIDTDSFIYYLGTKASTNDCQQSCIHFNYLCDTSTDNVLYGESAIQFDSDKCEITASKSDAFILLTSDLVSNEYIIEAQVTATSGDKDHQAGIQWKYDQTDYSSYYFAVDAAENIAITAWETTKAWRHIKSDAPSIAVVYNQKYNLTVHVSGTQFTTYFNGELYFTTSDPNDEIDETIFKWNYAGLYIWKAAAIFHSFKMQYPDGTDHSDEKKCAAYMHDKMDGRCYGYYGSDYAAIEASLAPDTQQKHDSAVLYHSTCDPTIAPTQPPVVTSNPTNAPSKVTPTDYTRNPSGRAGLYTVNPTPRWTTRPDTNADGERTTTQDSEERDSKPNDKVLKKQTATVVPTIIIAAVLIGLFVIGAVCICIFCRIRHVKATFAEVSSILEENKKRDKPAMPNVAPAQAQVLSVSSISTEPMKPNANAGFGNHWVAVEDDIDAVRDMRAKSGGGVVTRGRPHDEVHGSADRVDEGHCGNYVPQIEHAVTDISVGPQHRDENADDGDEDDIRWCNKQTILI